MKCNICHQNSLPLFKKSILKKYSVQYYRCPNCLFIQTEKPFWLDEAYKRAININDTGILARNIKFSKIISSLLFVFFNTKSRYLDFAGGYGTLTRLMRDIGFDYYWHDPFCENLVATGFEGNFNDQYEAISALEVFEHLKNPLSTIEEILTATDTIFISTELQPSDQRDLKNWWYFCPEHGQHISLYHKKTLETLAKYFGLHLYSNDRTFHILSKRRLFAPLVSVVFKFYQLLSLLVKRRIVSKTFTDYQSLS